MAGNALKQKWAAGEPSYGVWCAIPSSYVAEACAHAGFDYVCIDLQHGMIDYPVATEMILAAHAGGSVPIARVPSNDLGAINRMLDAGAMGIVVPLIESVADVEAAVRACRYPPDGGRSFGPNRAALAAGPRYFESANDNVLCIPMIETRPALDEIEAIAAVPGVDALYVGPNDLSLSLGQPPGSDNPDPYQSAYRRIAEVCAKTGVVAGIQANAKLAAKHVDTGYRMITISADAGTLMRGFASDLRSVRGE
ncbi:MAG: aldolase/citrate lyase family protein [Myxococcota bacterium]|nr:aldolase/citrate lyase family protein [Myxococcota bacterium]